MDKITQDALAYFKKYDLNHYRFLLTNNYERAVFLKGDPVFPREATRYLWANRNLKENLLGQNVLEIGCSTGYGSQFLPNNINYMGLDYDPIIIEVAREQEWGLNTSFTNADINTYPLAQYDTIIAFELIEHIDNGLEIAQKLKQHCKRLLLTTPHNEPVGFWGEHHKLHGLNESHFPDFQFNYINEHGFISETLPKINENNKFNLMIMRWDNE
jgi:2-polyprenyl-3-methyl-5-hydroxy-6-metoxy-1,4-benzoquinol methylase